jgi:hypothetical protein
MKKILLVSALFSFTSANLKNSPLEIQLSRNFIEDFISSTGNTIYSVFGGLSVPDLIFSERILDG